MLSAKLDSLQNAWSPDTDAALLNSAISLSTLFTLPSGLRAHHIGILTHCLRMLRDWALLTSQGGQREANVHAPGPGLARRAAGGLGRGIRVSVG